MGQDTTPQANAVGRDRRSADAGRSTDRSSSGTTSRVRSSASDPAASGTTTRRSLLRAVGTGVAGVAGLTGVGDRTAVDDLARTGRAQTATPIEIPVDLQLSVTNRSPTTASLDWTPEDALPTDRYELAVTSDGAPADVPGVSAVARPVEPAYSTTTLGGLSPGRTYDVTVRAYTEDDVEVGVGSATVTTPPFQGPGVRDCRFGVRHSTPDLTTAPWRRLDTVPDGEALQEPDWPAVVRVRGGSPPTVDVVGHLRWGSCHDGAITRVAVDGDAVYLSVGAVEELPGDCWTDWRDGYYRAVLELDRQPSTVHVEHGGQEPWDGVWTAGNGMIPSPAGTAPTDPDDDGVYEDLTGNEAMDYQDVVTLFQNLDADVVTKKPAPFDLTGNDEVDNRDVVALFAEI